MAKTIQESAQSFLPLERDLPHLRAAAQRCTACVLCQTGTQTVFGEGDVHAAVMLVGEQPGDEEDQTGRPFVGPSGRLLDRALETAGLDRAQLYVTNAVKHFKWTPGAGKRRIHAKPNGGEIKACTPWLLAEFAVVKPRIIVCLGATAAQALLGKDFRLTQHRGEFQPSPHAERVLATLHPSAILRAPDEDARAFQLAGLIGDFRAVRRALQDASAPLEAL